MFVALTLFFTLTENQPLLNIAAYAPRMLQSDTALAAKAAVAAK